METKIFPHTFLVYREFSAGSDGHFATDRFIQKIYKNKFKMKSAIIKCFFLSLNFEKLFKNTSKQQQRLLAVKQNAAKVNLVNMR